MVTSCDGMLGVASDGGDVGVGLEGTGVGLEVTGLGPGNGRAVRGGSAKYHVSVSVCMLLKDHALTEDNVNQWWRKDPWSELAAVCCPGCF